MKVLRYFLALASLATLLIGCGGDGVSDTTRDGGYFGSGLRSVEEPSRDGGYLGSGN